MEKPSQQQQIIVNINAPPPAPTTTLAVGVLSGLAIALFLSRWLGRRRAGPDLQPTAAGLPSLEEPRMLPGSLQRPELGAREGEGARVEILGRPNLAHKIDP